MWNTYVEEVVRKEVVNKRPVSGIETAKAKPITLHEIELENLRCAVEQLSDDEKFLLHLRYWCELSQVEIARQLGTTQQSVSYQERCVLRKLKKLLKN